MSGIVYLVGAGPGDPKLITLRAVELLKKADVVLYDRLVSKKIIAMIPKKTQKLYVGRDVGDDYKHQDTTNQLMVKYAKSYKRVVRLKGGDPFIFGRGGEEIETLAAEGIPFQVVPGITAASAASAQLRVSLTRRGIARSVALLTPRAGEGEHPSQALRANADTPTLALYMASHESMAIARELMSYGRDPGTTVAL
ncbi:MAG: uroporphyrinogen-III C-methyltransferase, partial [Candidatus Nitrosotenuis sp.]